MRITAAIDISTFIWNESDFDKNKSNYFGLLELMPVVYEQIISHKVPVLFRKELFDLLHVEFPYNMARCISNDFEPLTLSFLVKTISNWTLYSTFVDDSISTVPTIAKPHFSEASLFEVRSQIWHIFINDSLSNFKFITFKYFYNHADSLVLAKGDESKVVDTLKFCSQTDVVDFFIKYKIKFKHHEKHRKESYYDHVRSEHVSPFSCFHNQGEVAAQKLLDNAFFCEGHYYNFDLVNNVFVRFIKTSGFEYHGHDLLDGPDKVPNLVRKKFNK